MASFHCSIKVGGVGSGGPHAAYIAREGVYAKSELVERLVFAESGNLPAFSGGSAQAFWQAADLNERANGSVYREMEIALPRELSDDQACSLAIAYRKQFVGDDYAYTLAIHVPIGDTGEEQPHLHIMWSERKIDGIERTASQHFKRAATAGKDAATGGCKKVSAFAVGTVTERKMYVKSVREQVAQIQNEHLERGGFSTRVDSRSNADRGIALVPGSHKGPSVIAIEARGGRSDVAGRMADELAVEQAAIAERIAATARAEDDLVRMEAAENQLVQQLAVDQAATDAADQAALDADDGMTF